MRASMMSAVRNSAVVLSGAALLVSAGGALGQDFDLTPTTGPTFRPTTGPNRNFTEEETRKILEAMRKQPEPFIDIGEEEALAATPTSEAEANKMKEIVLFRLKSLEQLPADRFRNRAMEVKPLDVSTIPDWREGVIIRVKEGMLYLPYRSRQAVIGFPKGTDMRAAQWSWDRVKPGVAPPDQQYAMKLVIVDGGTEGIILEMTRQAIVTRLTLDETGELAANPRFRYVRSDETVDIGFMDRELNTKRQAPRVSDDMRSLLTWHLKLDIKPALVRAFHRLDAMSDYDLQLAMAAATPEAVKSAPDLESMIVQLFLFVNDRKIRTFTYAWESGDEKFMLYRQPGPKYVGETQLVFFRFGPNGNIRQWGTLTTVQPLTDEECLRRLRWFIPKEPPPPSPN